MIETMDAGQLSSWYDAHCDRLVLYARNWLPKESAQDVVQGAFVRLMMEKAAPKDVPAWLFRTVRNAAITRLRRRTSWSRRRTRLSAEQPSWFESRPEDLIDARTGNGTQEGATCVAADGTGPGGGQGREGAC